MKPSERIKELAYEMRDKSIDPKSANAWIAALIEYLDEVAEKDECLCLREGRKEYEKPQEKEIER